MQLDKRIGLSKEGEHMSFTIYARMKRIGKQKARELAPVPFVLDEKPKTVRQLILALTELGVRDYNARREEERILTWLTKEQIEGKAAEGKISFGMRGGEDASAEQAAANALQCFEDGIYRIFAGEDEMKKLDESIPWSDDLVFTFIRLTMLAG